MKRRQLISLFASTPAIWPLFASAQQEGKLPRIGVTLAGSNPNSFAEALRRGLKELGWVDGKTILIEERYAEGQTKRYAGFMSEFIDLKVDVIIAGGGDRVARVASELTSTIPIVVPVMGDPVASGLLSSLARPGGNLTGQSMQASEISAKRMEFLYRVLPKLEHIALLKDPNSPSAASATKIAEEAARALGIHSRVFNASRVEEFNTMFDTISASHAKAIMVLTSSFFYIYRQQLVDLAAQRRLAASYEHQGFVKAGGLMSYGPNLAAMYHSAARYVDKILKGESPADLPIEQPTQFDLAINLKTAKTLGLTMPMSILLQATEVIE